MKLRSDAINLFLSIVLLECWLKWACPLVLFNITPRQLFNELNIQSISKLLTIIDHQSSTISIAKLLGAEMYKFMPAYNYSCAQIMNLGLFYYFFSHPVLSVAEKERLLNIGCLSQSIMMSSRIHTEDLEAMLLVTRVDSNFRVDLLKSDRTINILNLIVQNELFARVTSTSWCKHLGANIKLDGRDRWASALWEFIDEECIDAVNPVLHPFLLGLIAVDHSPSLENIQEWRSLLFRAIKMELLVQKLAVAIDRGIIANLRIVEFIRILSTFIRNVLLWGDNAFPLVPIQVKNIIQATRQILRRPLLGIQPSILSRLSIVLDQETIEEIASLLWFNVDENLNAVSLLKPLDFETVNSLVIGNDESISQSLKLRMSYELFNRVPSITLPRFTMDIDPSLISPLAFGRLAQTAVINFKESRRFFTIVFQSRPDLSEMFLNRNLLVFYIPLQTRWNWMRKNKVLQRSNEYLSPYPIATPSKWDSQKRLEWPLIDPVNGIPYVTRSLLYFFDNNSMMFSSNPIAVFKNALEDVNPKRYILPDWILYVALNTFLIHGLVERGPCKLVEDDYTLGSDCQLSQPMPSQCIKPSSRMTKVQAKAYGTALLVAILTGVNLRQHGHCLDPTYFSLCIKAQNNQFSTLRQHYPLTDIKSEESVKQISTAEHFLRPFEVMFPFFTPKEIYSLLAC